MSETPAARRIRAQASPRDPQTMRFILDAAVQPGAATSFEGPDEKAPLASALFAIAGVQKVKVTAETIMVTCSPDHDWLALKAPVAAAIRQVLDESDLPLGDTSDDALPHRRDAMMLAKVNEILDREANPSIARHSGSVAAESVEDGIVYLRMSGGCQGCASSSRTLRNGIEKILRVALPEIREIIDITDHATGKNPYYRGEPGQAPTFSRPVPADCIGWEDGQLAIDPDYLSSRLGLTPQQLQDGLTSGHISIVTEAAPGDADAGRTRVIVRSTERAWAADVLPDGTAKEVPPPRLLSAAEQAINTLPYRVRSYLEALPPAKVPISYGRLARGLGMYAPGSISKVTSALEATMRQDAAAGRPFIAARAVSRGPAQSPGKGFFDLARALGRGPQPGESERDFHLRQLAASPGPA